MPHTLIHLYILFFVFVFVFFFIFYFVPISTHCFVRIILCFRWLKYVSFIIYTICTKLSMSLAMVYRNYGLHTGPYKYFHFSISIFIIQLVSISYNFQHLNLLLKKNYLKCKIRIVSTSLSIPFIPIHRREIDKSTR